MATAVVKCHSSTRTAIDDVDRRAARGGEGAPYLEPENGIRVPQCVERERSRKLGRTGKAIDTRRERKPPRSWPVKMVSQARPAGVSNAVTSSAFAPPSAAPTLVVPLTMQGPEIELASFGEMPRSPVMLADVVQVMAEPASTA